MEDNQQNQPAVEGDEVLAQDDGAQNQDGLEPLADGVVGEEPYQGEVEGEQPDDGGMLGQEGEAGMLQEGDPAMMQNEGELPADPQAVYYQEGQEGEPAADAAYPDQAPGGEYYQEAAPAEQIYDEQPQYDDQQPAQPQYDDQQGLMDEAHQDPQYEHAQPYESQLQEANDYGESAYDQQQPSDLYGGYDAAPAMDLAHDRHAAPVAPAVDIDSILADEREKHDQALKLESRAREELEDMILRIEKHFKAEQAARKKAEELLQQAIAAEMDAKNKLEDVMKRRGQEQKLLDEERNAIKRERQALESMRQEFDNELQAARSEVAKAQEALAGSEERIRSAEQVERARLETEYQTKLATLQAENDRLRDEMGYRTMVMQDEMEKWRQQASITANAVLEAKQEVNERKRELDHTKDKMDRLLDKLLVGRERNIELQGAIASNQRMLGYMPGSMGMGGMGNPGMNPGMGSMGVMGGKMPPMVQMPQGPWMNGMMPMPQLQQQFSGKQKLPPLYGGGGQGGGSWSGDASPGPKSSGARRAASTEHYRSGGEDSDGGNYSHVQSKFAQGAAEVGLKNKTKGVSKNARNKPDRFAEASKDASRNAAMSRWN